MKDAVVYIDKGIACLSKIKLHDEVQSINVHCNKIKKITCLQHLTSLKHLDVSSNQLSDMNGLHGLSSLTTLNLSCNFITSLSGIKTLCNLRYINLSYNRLQSVSEFADFHGSTSLEIVELHGNLLSKIEDLLLGFQNVIRLKHLLLKCENADNQICNYTGYRETLLNGLPQLVSLDGLNRSSNAVNVDHSFSINELEAMLTPITLQTSTLDCGNNGSSSDADLVHQSALMKEKQIPCPQNIKILPASFEAEHEMNVHCSTKGIDGKSSKNLQFKKDDELHNHSPLTAKRHNVMSSNRKLRIQKKCRMKKTTETTAEQKNRLSLAQELQCERERRWKAERSSRKLAEIIMNKQSEASNEKTLQNMASDVAERLKTCLLQEQEVNQQLRKKILTKQEELHKLKEELSQSCNANKEQEQTIKKLVHQVKRVSTENKKLKDCNDEKIRLLQGQLKDMTYKYDKANQNICKLRTALKQLENSLTEEKKIRSIPKDYILVKSDEFQKIVDSHLKDVNQQCTNLLSCADTKNQMWQRDYKKLENEFREALSMENHRFLQLKCANLALSDKTKDLESCLKEAVEKDEKSKIMIQELSSIVKDQKLKFNATVDSKEAFIKHLKERIHSLELEGEGDKKKVAQVESLKQEKSHLVSQITAMQSTINNLKDEQKQREMELAQQGSLVAQDQGRMEIKIERLEAEVLNLQKINEREVDALRIKSKVLDDQVETIMKLKEALSAKDQEIRRKLDDSLAEEQRLQQIIDSLTQENGDLLEENKSYEIKNHSLKENLKCSKEDYKTLQITHGKLKTQWTDKVKMLSKLEVQVKSLNENMHAREQKLQHEKDSAIYTSRNLLTKIEENNSIHVEQLEALKRTYNNELIRKETDKENEIQMLTKQVQEVEGEMRKILKDAEFHKQAYETKMRIMKQTFQDISVNV